MEDGEKGSDVPGLGAGHPERTPGMFNDMRKSKVGGWVG